MMSAAAVRARLNASAVAPKTLIELTWMDKGKPRRWVGFTFEPIGRRDRRRWHVEYRWERGDDGRLAPLLDDDNDPSVITSTLPRNDVQITNISFPADTTLPNIRSPQGSNSLPTPSLAPAAVQSDATTVLHGPPQESLVEPPSGTQADETLPNLPPAPQLEVTTGGEGDAPDVTAAPHRTNDDEPNTSQDSSDDDSDDEWDQLGFPSPALVANFREGHGASVLPVTLMKARELLPLLDLPVPRLPKIVDQGLAKATRSAHRRLLNFVASNMPASDGLLSATVLATLQQCKTQRKWKHSTMMRYLAGIQGALAILPLYRATTAPVLLNEDPVWRQALKAATLHAKEESPCQPEPATLNDVKTAIRSEQHLGVKIAIILAWVTCARVGCVLQLRVADLSLSEGDTNLAVTFRRGKGVRFRGPYTVHTKLPQAWSALLLRWLRQRKTTLFPANVTGPQVKIALRRALATLEQRSLRRGSLQHLAEMTDIKEEQLLLFSGHSSITTLRRYLNWGSKGRDRKEMMHRAAAALTNP